MYHLPGNVISAIVDLVYERWINAATVAVGKGKRGHMSPGASGGAPKGGAVFLRHEIYENSVSSVEVGMGMEGQIMCIEQCTLN